jgi:ABC-type sugar transport system permease subunit
MSSRPIDMAAAEELPRPRRRRPTASREALPYLAPAAILTIVLGLLPLLALLCFSFFDWSLTRPDSGAFIGLGNYLSIAKDPVFWHALRVTLQIAVETIVAQLVFGVAIALLLNRNLPGMGILRAFVMAPMMMAPLFAGLIWRLALSSDFGILPYLLTLVGVEAPPVFLSDPNWALHAIVLVTVWQTTPFVVLFVIAALQIIPNELYEAARLDGAGAFRLFWSITLPLLRPVLLTIVLFNIIDSVKIFDPIYALTTGGPGDATESLSYLIYLETSTFFEMGYGSALAVITLIIVSIPVLFILQKNAQASRPAMARGGIK